MRSMRAALVRSTSALSRRISSRSCSLWAVSSSTRCSLARSRLFASSLLAAGPPHLFLFTPRPVPAPASSSSAAGRGGGLLLEAEPGGPAGCVPAVLSGPSSSSSSAARAASSSQPSGPAPAAPSVPHSGACGEREGASPSQ